MSKTILITGQSGLNSSDVLSMYVNSQKNVGGISKVAIYKIEEGIVQSFLKKKRLNDSPAIWLGLLKQPAAYLQDLWDESIKQIISKIKRDKPQLAFINFHACFYHHDTVEFLSFAKETLLKRIKPDFIVTLIDDIYDTHARLRQKNQLFHKGNGGAQEPIGAILELMNILDWRANEILVSKHLAVELEIPHFIFSIKHQQKTLEKLSSSNSKKFYISHPISEVRRLTRAGKETLAQKMISEVHEFENEISRAFTCFLPTTIDELRINFTKEANKTMHIAELDKRWDLLKYENPEGLLYNKPTYKSPDPLWNKANVSPENSSRLGPLLSSLSKRIEAQVSSRDHKLVEQSDCLAVYRPMFNGNASNGVLKEIGYFDNLSKLKKAKRHCFIYLPKKDYNAFLVRNFVKIFNVEIKKGNIRFSNGEERGDQCGLKLSEDQEKKLVSANLDSDTICQLLDDIIDSTDFSVHSERSGLEQDKAQQADNFKKEMVCEYVQSVKNAVKKYRDVADRVWDNDDIAPHTFVQMIKDELSKGRGAVSKKKGRGK